MQREKLYSTSTFRSYCDLTGEFLTEQNELTHKAFTQHSAQLGPTQVPTDKSFIHHSAKLVKLLRFVFLFQLIVFCLAPSTTSAQKLTFCESVDVGGKYTGASDVFTVSSAGGYFQLLVNLADKVASKHVLFDVYWVDPTTKKELFENSIRVPVDPTWIWFKKEVTFYKAGDYVVYVYNDQDLLISAGKVKIIVQ